MDAILDVKRTMVVQFSFDDAANFNINPYIDQILLSNTTAITTAILHSGVFVLVHECHLDIRKANFYRTKYLESLLFMENVQTILRQNQCQYQETCSRG